MSLRTVTRAIHFLSSRYCSYGLFCLHRLKTKHGVRTLSGISRSGFDDYEKERSSWNLVIPEKFNFASDVIDVWAKKEKEGVRNPAVPAFWYVSDTDEDVKWTFQELESETKKVANMLQNLCGVKHGDNIIVMLPKVPEFWLVNIAAIRIGAALSPSSMMLTRKDLEYRFSSLQPSCIIAHESVTDLIDEVTKGCSFLKTKLVVYENKGNNSNRKPDWTDFQGYVDASTDHKCSETGSDETMAIFFTSGTTGFPKMTEHSHSSYGIGHFTSGKFMLDLTRESVFWNLSDTGWAKTAYSSIFAPWSLGSCAFVHKMPRFSAPHVLEVLTRYPIDTVCLPPMAYRFAVQEDLSKYKFSKLSHCVTGGESLGPEVLKRWKNATGLNIYECYGQTETVLTIGMYKCIEFRPGSIGKMQPAVDVVILDKDNKEVGPCIQGEIALKKRNGRILGAFKGYKNDEEKTKSVLTEKYLYTGDIGYYDKDGYFWFVGRKDDVINSAGYRIGPSEVESALMEHPAVVEVAVTSSPDTQRGEVVKAFIVLKDSYACKPETELIQELQEHTKRITAPYKYPRKIEFVKELPKTISGKIKRRELKNMEWNGRI